MFCPRSSVGQNRSFGSTGPSARPPCKTAVDIKLTSGCAIKSRRSMPVNLSHQTLPPAVRALLRNDVALTRQFLGSIDSSAACGCTWHQRDLQPFHSASINEGAYLVASFTKETVGCSSRSLSCDG